MKSGTWPNTSTIGAITPINIVVGTEDTPTTFGYEVAGTKSSSENVDDEP